MTFAVFKVGEWKKALRLTQMAKRRLDRAMMTALLQEARFFQKKVKQGIRNQAPAGRKRFKPIAPTTRATRRLSGFRGSKALAVRGDLRNSVTVVARPAAAGGAVFVGVLRTALSRDGEKLFDIAKMNEEGSRPIPITVTPKMRAFLFAAFKKAGIDTSRGGGRSKTTGIIIVKIPKRPFLQPVFDRFGKRSVAARRYTRRVAVLLRGDYGIA